MEHEILNEIQRIFVNFSRLIFIALWLTTSMINYLVTAG